MQQAIYIEQKVKKGPQAGKTIGWAGYAYADDAGDLDNYKYIRQATDQWGNEIAIYKAQHIYGLETPGGIKRTNLVTLYKNFNPRTSKVEA